MPHPIFNINLCKGFILHDEHILGILILGSLGKIEAPGDDRLLVNDYDFIVRYGMFGIDIGGNAGMGREVPGAVFGSAVGLVHDDLDVNAALMGFDDGRRDLLRRKRVGLDEDLGLCLADLIDNGVGASALRRKVDLDRGFVEGKVGRTGCLMRHGKSKRDKNGNYQQVSIFHDRLRYGLVMASL